MGLVLLAPLLLSAACRSDHDVAPAASQGGKPGADATQAAETSKATITVTPADGVTKVEPNTAILVSARDGKLTAVTVKDSDGKKVSGDLAAGGGSWNADGLLHVNEKYTVKATAVDDKGLEATLTSTFKTVRATKLVRTAVVPLSGETVGVGQPIAVALNTTVKKSARAVVERKLRVTSTPDVVGAWHWIDGRHLRYRPKTYWPAGTDVRLHISLTGVKVGTGIYGGESRTISFHVGRSMVSVVSIASHTMKVYRNQKLVRTIPISTGKKGFETRGGIKVVLEKTQHKVMDASSIGIPKNSPEYYHLDVYWAVRVTWSGEFAHAAPWSEGSQGHANVSHGCVGMSTENATWYYRSTVRGDVVRVEGNPGKRMELDNGYGDWNLSWSAWKAGSALT